MAVSLRRALFSKNYFYALRAASISSHQTFSCLASSYFENSRESVVVDRFLSYSATIISQFNTRRGFAKGRKPQIKEEEEDEDEEEVEEEEGDDDDEGEQDGDLGARIKTTAISQMNAAVDSLSRELTKLRTGRASSGMLDHIMVEHYGVKTPLNRMAVVSVLDPKTLAVTPYDPNALKELEKAIISSPLGLNPKSDNQRLVAPIPPLTKEHIQAVCKVVSKSSEDVKQSIGRARQKKELAGLRRINLEGLRWRVFDAKGQVLGRLASHISTVVQGKDKPTYTPNREEGDMCIIINAKDVCVTGRKMMDKFYRWHTGYVGHLKERSLKDQMAKDPTEVIRKAVLRMLPRNKLRDDRDRKLRIFSGNEHPFGDRLLEPYVMPPRQVREMRPRARRAMIRAQKKAEQQEQGTSNTRKGKKRSGVEPGISA